MVHDQTDFDSDLYSVPARICLGIAIASSALLTAAAITGYFL